MGGSTLRIGFYPSEPTHQLLWTILRESNMAARINKRHSDEIRAKIQASCLIHRLQQCGMGEIDLTPTQVNAINSLLDRSVPKLSQIQHVGDADNPVQNVTRIELIALGSRSG